MEPRPGRAGGDVEHLADLVRDRGPGSGAARGSPAAPAAAAGTRARPRRDRRARRAHPGPPVRRPAGCGWWRSRRACGAPRRSRRGRASAGARRRTGPDRGGGAARARRSPAPAAPRPRPGRRHGGCGARSRRACRPRVRARMANASRSPRWACSTRSRSTRSALTGGAHRVRRPSLTRGTRSAVFNIRFGPPASGLAERGPEAFPELRYGAASRDSPTTIGTRRSSPERMRVEPTARPLREQGSPARWHLPGLGCPDVHCGQDRLDQLHAAAVWHCRRKAITAPELDDGDQAGLSIWDVGKYTLPKRHQDRWEAHAVLPTHIGSITLPHAWGSWHTFVWCQAARPSREAMSAPDPAGR